MGRLRASRVCRRRVAWRCLGLRRGGRILRCLWRGASSRHRLGLARRKHGRCWTPFSKARTPDQIDRSQMTAFDQQLHFRVGDRTVLLSVPRDVPLDFRFCPRHRAWSITSSLGINLSWSATARSDAAHAIPMLFGLKPDGRQSSVLGHCNRSAPRSCPDSSSYLSC